MPATRGRPKGATTSKAPASPVAPISAQKRCTLDPDVHERMLALEQQGFTGAAIARDLKRNYPERAPHENTVYDELRRHAADASGVWSLADESFSDHAARLVLDELRHVYGATHGHVRHLSKRVAWWVARLRSVRDDLQPGDAYDLARMHVYRENGGQQLDAWVDATEPALARLRALMAPEEKGGIPEMAAAYAAQVSREKEQGK